MNEKRMRELLEGLDSEEAEERLRVVEEAKSWLNTPYHPNADVKGAGVDCGMLLVRVYGDTGIIEKVEPRPYPIQWSFHQRAERYLDWIKRFSHEIEELPLPGDVALFQVGHTWSHGSIVLAWPEILHSNPPGRCRVDHCKNSLNLTRRIPRFFSAWPKELRGR